MIVLQPTTAVQGFVVTQRVTDLAALPRANKLQITDEETNISRVITITATTPWDYYDTLSLTINP